MTKETGQCLCGAIKFSVDTVDHIDSCHCESCRRWGTGPFIGIETQKVAFDSDETLTWYASSEWASRGFCSTCGSSLFYKLADYLGGTYSISAGAFDELPDTISMTKEIFIDSKPDYYAFTGDRPRLTGEQVFAAAQAEQDQ